MQYKSLFAAAVASLLTSAAATSTYDVVNNCGDTKYLTLSNNAQGVLNFNDELPSGTSRHYEIVSDHSLAVANSTDYWNASTYKLVLGTNSDGGILYYAVGTANGYPLVDKAFSFSGNGCPSITNADGQTQGCTDNNVAFQLTLCS